MSFDMLADGKVVVSHEIKIMIEVELVEQKQEGQQQEKAAAATA